MRKILSLIVILALFLCLFSCSSKSVKSDLSPETVATVYDGTPYSTWCHEINDEDLDVYRYRSELKVYHPESESKDYVFIYFFESAEEAKAYEKEHNSKAGVTWFFSLLFGEETKVHYDRYDYMVVESYESDTAKSRNDMIRIFKSAIYES